MILLRFSKSELVTTEIELSAIARPAISGRKVNPAKTNTPAAIGIPAVLYAKEKDKF